MVAFTHLSVTVPVFLVRGTEFPNLCGGYTIYRPEIGWTVVGFGLVGRTGAGIVSCPIWVRPAPIPSRCWDLRARRLTGRWDARSRPVDQ